MTITTDQRFAADTADHEITVIHDVDDHIHLRFKKPGTSFYWFDIVTWPGVLTITGDMGTYVFARELDMLGFFRGDRINPGYWAEKLRANSGVKEYSEDKFRRLAIEHATDRSNQYPGLIEAVAEMLSIEDIYDASHARDALDLFEHKGFTFVDTWEWDLTDYTHQFLWCCHAIIWGIAQYDAHRATVAA